MSRHTNPFEILGLPVRRDLTDAQVNAAWRKTAVATHPDRPDGGDLARYTQASAAFAELRVPWSRSEAHADGVEQARPQGYDGLDDDGQPRTRGSDGLAADGQPYTEPLPRVPSDPESGIPYGDPIAILIQLPSRISRGRPLHLAPRAVIAPPLPP